MMPLCNEDAFYSLLIERIKSVPMKKAPPRQWLGTICNMGQEGIRQEEIECSGLLEWLDGQSGSVSKESLLEHACFDDIKIKLVTEFEKNINPHLDFQEQFRTSIPSKHKWLKDDMLSPGIWYREKIFGYQIVRIRRNDLFGQYGYWLLLNHENQLVSLPKRQENVLICDGYPTPEAAMDAAHDDVKMKFSDIEWRSPSRHWRYENWYGGKNYCEWLLTIPSFPESYYSEHFKTPNIVAHVRCDERKDVFGRRILFLQEIQSDWHQNGRLHGYNDTDEDSNIPYGPFVDSWHELAIKTMFYIASKSDIDGIAWTTGAQQEERWKHYYRHDPSILDGLAVFYDKKIPKFIRRLTKQFDVKPSETSFETKENNFYASRKNEGWVLMEENSDEPMSEPFQNRKVAEDLASRKNTKIYVKAPMLLLTDSMKAHIKQHGVPLFGCYPKC